MNSVMTHQFSQVPRAEIQRSRFDRSHGFKTTFNAGYLVPFYVDEALPGDTFNCRVTTFARLATPIVPIMDNMFCDLFFFAVPYRLIWDNWQKFNGEQVDPGDPTDFLCPQMATPALGWALMGLGDYFGLPTLIPGLPTVNSFHFRAYNLIWNEWFRDQNLQDSVVVDRDNGPDDPADYNLLRRGRRHDYFTSCLPWPQKGPAVELPLGSTAPVIHVADSTGMQPVWRYIGNPPTVPTVLKDIFSTPAVTSPPGYNGAVAGETTGVYAALSLDPDGTLLADLSTATAATINSLRQAFQIQRMYERDARGGTRYTEIIRAHFGVVSPDARLQRPEYLGGGSTRIGISPVAQTSSTGTVDVPTSTPQGNLAAIGTFSHSGDGFTKSFTEHCVLIGMLSVRADLNYQYGINRMWSRQTRFDFFWPALAHLGEQAVLNQEIYAQGTGHETENVGVFGYQERFAEYRYKPSVISGQFRSSSPGSLDIWHLAAEYSSLPALNDTFIQDNPPVDRIIAVEDQPQFLLDCYVKLNCARPMPVYGVPGMIDHF